MRYTVTSARLRQETPYYLGKTVFRAYAYTTRHHIEPSTTRAAFLTAYLRYMCPHGGKHILHSQDVSTVCIASIVTVCTQCDRRGKCPLWLDMTRQCISWHSTLPVIEDDVTWLQHYFIGKHKLGGAYVLLGFDELMDHLYVRIPRSLLVEEVTEPLVLSLNDLLKFALEPSDYSSVRVYEPIHSVKTEVGLRKETSTASAHMLFTYEVVIGYRARSRPIIRESAKTVPEVEAREVLTQDYYTFFVVPEDLVEVFENLLRLMREQELPLSIGRGRSRGLGLFKILEFRIQDLEEFTQRELNLYRKYLSILVEKSRVVPLVPESQIALISTTNLPVREAVERLVRQNLEERGLDSEHISVYGSAENLEAWSSTSRIRKYPAATFSGRLFLKIKPEVRPEDARDQLLDLFIRGLHSSKNITIVSGFNVVKVPVIALYQ